MSWTLSTRALTIALVLALVSCSRDESVWSPLALDPPEAIPLAWPDTNTLVVGYRGSLYRYDLAGRKLGEQIAESYAGSYEPNCFGPKGGYFRVFPPVVTTKNGTKRTSAPKNQRIRQVPEWSRPDVYTEEAEPALPWSTNPLDCSRIDPKEYRNKFAARIPDGRRVVSLHPLLAAGDADAFVTLPKGARPAGRILHIYRVGAYAPPLDLPLPGATEAPADFNSVVRSYRESDGGYLIYESNSQFDANLSPWPLTAWRLGPDLLTVRAITLPAGPWVVPHGFLKSMSCFSCGCSCYAHFDLAGANGRVYAHVYGKSVEDSTAGVYELVSVDGRATWVRRVAGNFGGRILVSPDGCSIAYSDVDGRLQLARAGSCG